MIPILDCTGQEELLYCVLCWDEFELPVMTLALARGEGGEL